jgi:hypothetical protein
MRLGIDPEQWTVVWGVVFYAATIAVLCALRRTTAKSTGGSGDRIAARRPPRRPSIATGTSTRPADSRPPAFTFFVTLAYALAVAPARPPVDGGLTLALVALTRPDGIGSCPSSMVYMCWQGRPA